MYIGESPNSGDQIRRLDCTGNIFTEATFSVTSSGQTNIAAKQFVELENVTRGDWGFYYDKKTDTFYSTTQYAPNSNPNNIGVWIYIESDFDNDPATTVPLAFSIEPQLGINTNFGSATGITTDCNGNIYVVLLHNGDTNVWADANSQILKYASDGTFLAASAVDVAEDGTGWSNAHGAHGIVYSETSDLIYVSTTSDVDDCVALFDTNLNYIGAAVPSPGDGSASKGMSILSECCPVPAVQTIDLVYCADGTNEQLFLGELFPCEDGIICEAIWEPVDAPSTNIYNSCDQSIAANAPIGCYTYNKASDGSNLNAQCGAFNLTLNICYNEAPPAPVISISDNDCANNTNGTINVDTPCANASTIEWSTDGGGTWSAAQPAYGTSAVTIRARCVDATCASAATADITSAPEVCTECPPLNCIRQLGQFTIQKRIP